MPPPPYNGGMIPRSILLLSVLMVPATLRADFAALQSVVRDHCVKCHGPTASKGGVTLGPLESPAAVLKHRKLWRNVVAQIEKGEMPPEGEKPLAKDLQAKSVAWVRNTLDAADKAGDPAVESRGVQPDHPRSHGRRF
jgi:mono/diheme cytochrome c family protein